MNSFQNCRNTSDAIPLYLPQNLYLKPIARINISVQLPQIIEPGKSISNWEIMEKLRAMIKPDEFSILKISKSSLEVLRFEAETEDKSKLHKLIALLDVRSMKLNAFVQPCKIRAAEAKQDYPTRHTWDTFFRDAKNMNEMKFGERPDTIHISNLPIRWFVTLHHVDDEDVKPSQKILHRIFEKFGQIRVVDIPICDPYRKKMKEHMSGMNTFTFDEDTFFEGYVQFKDYMGFVKAMDAFRGMKLLYKDPRVVDGMYPTVNIKVDFDRTKHLSDASIKRRQIVRDRFMEKDREAEEKETDFKKKLEEEEITKRQREQELKEAKEKRRREREEKRKARCFAQLNIKESDELKKKIIKEEKKLKKVEIELQSIRVLSDLFDRIKKKHEQSKAKREGIDKGAVDELTKYRLLTEQKLEDQRSKLSNARSGQIILSSILASDDDKKGKSVSSSDSDKKDKKHKKKKKKKKKKHKKKKDDKSRSNSPSKNPSTLENLPLDGNPWYGYPHPPNMYPIGPMYPHPMRGHFPPGFYPNHRGRGALNGVPGPSRGFPRRRGSFNPHFQRGWGGRRGGYNNMYTPELQEEYYKYFLKFLKDQDSNSRSYSRSRSRSRSRSSRKSHSRRRSYSRSRDRSYSRRRTRSRSRSRSRRSRSRTRSRSRSRSRSRDRNRDKKSWSPSRSRSRSRRHSKSPRSSRRSRSKSKSHRSRKSHSKGRSRSKTRKTRSRSKSKSRTPKNGKKNSKDRSRSPSYLSIDSSKFISPSRLRTARSRSKSWSLPKSNSKKDRSWSKSPSPKNK